MSLVATLWREISAGLNGNRRKAAFLDRHFVPLRKSPRQFYYRFPRPLPSQFHTRINILARPTTARRSRFSAPSLLTRDTRASASANLLCLYICIYSVCTYVYINFQYYMYSPLMSQLQTLELSRRRARESSCGLDLETGRRYIRRILSSSRLLSGSRLDGYNSSNPFRYSMARYTAIPKINYFRDRDSVEVSRLLDEINYEAPFSIVNSWRVFEE